MALLEDMVAAPEPRFEHLVEIDLRQHSKVEEGEGKGLDWAKE